MNVYVNTRNSCQISMKLRFPAVFRKILKYQI